MFDRRGYRPKLTKEGKQFYDLSKRLLDVFDKEALAIKENYELDHNTITIGITTRIDTKELISVVKKFKQTHHVNINIQTMDMADCYEALIKQEIDVGISLYDLFAQNKDLITYKLYSTNICVVTSLDHPLAQKKEVRPSDLKDESFVILSNKFGQKLHNEFLSSFKLDGFHPLISKEVDNFDDFFIAIQLDEGIGLTTKETVSIPDQVALTPLINSHHHADFGIAYHQSSIKSIVEEFIHDVTVFFASL